MLLFSIPDYLSRWLYWDDPFPRIIQKCLSKSWPNAKLFIEGLSIGFQTDVDEVQLLELDLLKSLVDFQNIHSVKVVIEYENPVAMRWLKDVLLGSPKLEIFHLTLPRDRDGKVEWTADGLGSYDLCVESGECLAPLKELLYEIRRPPYTEDRPLIPPSFFNLTQIRCLELKGFDIEKFLVQLKDQPLHLDALTITSFTDPFFSGFNATLEELIPQLRGVGTLRIITTMELLPTYHFFHLSDTITDFEFRSARDCIDSFPYMVTRSFFLPNQLDELRTACPLISSLVLDMKIGDNLVRNVSHPLLPHTYAVLALRLSRLTRPLSTTLEPSTLFPFRITSPPSQARCKACPHFNGLLDSQASILLPTRSQNWCFSGRAGGYDERPPFRV